MNLPSVTRIIGPWADFSGIRPEVLAHASARGTAVHAACGALALGLWVPPVDEEVAPFVWSFQKWFPVVVEVVAVEVELIDLALGYCGHPDIICRIRGDKALALIDLKTPASKSPLWKAQLAAYKHLARRAGYDVQRVGSLRLKRDGGMPIFDEYMDSATDLAGFLAALSAHRYFNQNN